MSQRLLVEEESYYIASQWQLMWRKLTRHRLAIGGGIVLAVFYILAIFCEFFATYDLHTRHTTHIYAPPQRIRFFHEGKFSIRPFVYGLKGGMNPETYRRVYRIDTSKRYPVYLFARGEAYKLWGLIKTDIHFLGVREGSLFLFGTDELGRDLFSRNLYGSRISLSIGLIGVFLGFILGCIFGGISGYYSGTVDMVIQRMIEFLMAIPTIPLWLALSAALPPDWSPLMVYFGITLILSLRGWVGLARVVRGKFLELRDEDFVVAAKIAGMSDGRIIARHLIPSFLSYLIVSLTLAIPGMILGETSLSFLGLGLRPPVVSWGVLLREAQNVQTIAHHPWLLIPGLYVIVTVLAFNFLGDGMRDAADPYK